MIPNLFGLAALTAAGLGLSRFSEQMLFGAHMWEVRSLEGELLMVVGPCSRTELLLTCKTLAVDIQEGAT